MDRLSSLFSRFAPSARVFHTGALCSDASFDAVDGVGYLHLLRKGELSVSSEGINKCTLVEPTALFFPRACGHRLLPTDNDGAELFCASLMLGSGDQNPLVYALPKLVILPLRDVPNLQMALELLFTEGLSARCGRQAALNRLMEYILIELLRHLLDNGVQSRGLIGALAEPRLARAVTAMHEQPERRWTVESLAQEASMSRARFALLFRQVVGTTPLDYLTAWRVGVAQTLLLQGKSVKTVASAVGYQNQAALSRTFSQRLGLSPRQWLDANVEWQEDARE